MHMAELLDGMFPSAAARGGTPRRSFATTCNTEMKNLVPLCADLLVRSGNLRRPLIR
jgi:hypothetical protein